MFYVGKFVSMGVECMKKHVGNGIISCYGSVSRHPMLMFMFLVVFWMYRCVPALFWFLVYASPVMASTSILLGTLLYYGHAQVAEAEKGKKVKEHQVGDLVNEYTRKKLKKDMKSEVGGRKFEKVVLVEKSSEFGSRGRSSRRNSIGYINDEEFSKGWDSGSDIGGSESPPMLDERHPLLDAEARQRSRMWNVGVGYSWDRSFESGEMVNGMDGYDDDEDGMGVDDEDESVMKWTEDDQRNLMNLGMSDLERNKRLENLIARQKALKNMRMLAEKKPFDLTYDSNGNILGSAPTVMIPRRNPFDFPFDPSDVKHDRVGDNFHSDSLAFHTEDPFIHRHQSLDVGPSTSIGSADTENDPLRKADLPSVKVGSRASDLSEYIIQRNQFNEDEGKITGANETGNEDKLCRKSSSSLFFDVTEVVYNGDDDEDEEFRSIENESAEDLKELQVGDSSVYHSAIGDSGTARLLKRFSKVKRLTSWLTGKKA